MTETAMLIVAALLTGGIAGYLMACRIEQARSRAVRQTLRKLVEVADTSPFARVAFVVEHALPDVRRLAQVVGHD